jgi:hypothetical protein
MIMFEHTPKYVDEAGAALLFTRRNAGYMYVDQPGSKFTTSFSNSHNDTVFLPFFSLMNATFQKTDFDLVQTNSIVI